jgi:uncharacterized glyoxalase superfamily protein PhnB
MTTTWKPDGYNSVSPYLVTEKAQEIIDFLISSVGAAPLRRFENEDGAIMHAEVRLDDTVIMMGGPPEGFSAVLCHPLGSMYTCPDVDQAYAVALESGGGAGPGPGPAG